MLVDKVVTLILGAVFLIVLSCEGPATEQQTIKRIPAAQSLLHEPIFWDYAASSNMLQVEVAKVVTEKGATATVRSMAAEALHYHSQALEELKAVVREHQNIQLPGSLGGADQGLVLEFKTLEGEALDARFQEFMLNSHKSQFNRYSEALSKADDEQIRNWLKSMQAHLRERVETLAETGAPKPAEEGKVL